MKPPKVKTVVKKLSAPTKVFGVQAKKPESDDQPRKMRPVAHAPVQAARAKRAAAVVKRLSGKRL